MVTLLFFISSIFLAVVFVSAADEIYEQEESFDSNLIESEHPYPVFCDETKVIYVENAKWMKVTFDEKTCTTSNAYIELYHGKEHGFFIGKYIGCNLSGKTIVVPGDTLKVRLTSRPQRPDDKLTQYGYKVTSVVPYYEECKHLTTEIKEYRKPTCYLEGYTGDVHCAECFEKIESGEYIPKLPHPHKSDGIYCLHCDLKVYRYQSVQYDGEQANAAVISEYIGAESDFVVPNILDDYIVVGIEETAFKGNDVISSITIPESITRIAENAFDGCASLDQIIYEGDMFPCPVDKEELSEKASHAFIGNGRIEIDFENTTDSIAVVEFVAKKTGFHYMFTEGDSLDAVWVYDKDGNLMSDGYDDSLDGNGDVKLYVDCAKLQKYYVVIRCIGGDDPTEFAVNYTSDVCGDASADGKVGIPDVLKIRKVVAGLESEDAIDILSADTNSDGKLNIADVLLVRKYIAGLITEFTDHKAIYCPKLYFTGDMTEMTSKKDVRKITYEYKNKDQVLTGAAKIKIQGSSSTRYDKKNYTINFYEDTDYSNKTGVDVGWGAQNEYCLKANWIDKTHTRNVVTAKLAGEAQKQYGLFSDAPSGGTVDGFPVEVYINGEFHGLYTMNIPKDAWMFGMDEDDPNHIVICGEDWSDPVLFKTVPTDFSSWSVEVGTENDATLEKIQRLISFVRYSSDEEFVSDFGQYLDLDSTLNYYVFMHYCWMGDNAGKNMILATYDGELWYPSFYDLDTTWGTDWQGTGLYNYKTKMFSSDGSVLWERMEKLFKEEIAERYFELRESVLDTDYVKAAFNGFYNSIPEKVLEKEAEKWDKTDAPIPGYPISQIDEYIDTVIPRLDEKYGAWR